MPLETLFFCLFFFFFNAALIPPDAFNNVYLIHLVQNAPLRDTHTHTQCFRPFESDSVLVPPRCTLTGAPCVSFAQTLTATLIFN